MHRKLFGQGPFAGLYLVPDKTFIRLQALLKNHVTKPRGKNSKEGDSTWQIFPECFGCRMLSQNFRAGEGPGVGELH